MHYKKYKKEPYDIEQMFYEKKSFKLFVGATWCPDCNVIKYGTEEVSDGKGILLDKIDDSYVMLTEDVALEDRNEVLIPFMVHVEDITGVKYRDITYGLCPDENIHKRLTNADSYRPYVPYIMIVEEGKPTYIQCTFENESAWDKIKKN